VKSVQGRGVHAWTDTSPRLIYSGQAKPSRLLLFAKFLYPDTILKMKSGRYKNVPKDKNNAANRTPQWQPIERLGLIAYTIRGMFESAEEQYGILQGAIPRPYVLDDKTVKRVIDVYTVQQKDLWLFDEQLKRWKAQKLTPVQSEEVEKLTLTQEQLTKVVKDILALAAQLKEQTIEKTLAKSDLEIGLEFLLKSRSQGDNGRSSGKDKKPGQ
jgi:hypothetical protein